MVVRRHQAYRCENGSNLILYLKVSAPNFVCGFLQEQQTLKNNVWRYIKICVLRPFSIWVAVYGPSDNLEVIIIAYNPQSSVYKSC